MYQMIDLTLYLVHNTRATCIIAKSSKVTAVLQNQVKLLRKDFIGVDFVNNFLKFM